MHHEMLHMHFYCIAPSEELFLVLVESLEILAFFRVQPCLPTNLLEQMCPETRGYFSLDLEKGQQQPKTIEKLQELQDWEI